MDAYILWVERHAKSILTVILLGGLAVRFTVWILFQLFDSTYLLTNSLTDIYLFPRLSLIPWKVDWSYGPLTYLLYWVVSRASYATILGKIINFLADSISAYLVAAISVRFISISRSLLAATCWMFAPPLVWASVFGSVDSVPILATLGAVYFVLNGRIRFAVLLIGVGFALKWYPILILPLVLRSYLSKHDPPRLILFSLYPFALTGLLMIFSSYTSGVNSTNELALALHNFSSRGPAGPSIWNLFQAIVPTQRSFVLIPSLVIYFLMLIALATLSLKSPVSSGFQFLHSSTNILFALINIASQIQGNYLLWYYPLMLIVILKEQLRLRLFVKLSLLALSFIFNYLFIYPRLGVISQGPLALIASANAYDILTIVAYQASIWLLFYLLTRPESTARTIKRDFVATIRT